MWGHFKTLWEKNHCWDLQSTAPPGPQPFHSLQWGVSCHRAFALAVFPARIFSSMYLQTLLHFWSLLECSFTRLVFLTTLHKTVTPFPLILLDLCLSYILITSCPCVFADLFLVCIFHESRDLLAWFISLFYPQILEQGLANSSI